MDVTKGDTVDVAAVGTMSTAPPPPLDASGELPRGAILDRYIVLKRIGRGGMGVVYLALDSELERRVAIKVLRPETMAGGSAGETRSRLLREAQAMAKVSHPNVVAIYDVGTFGEEVFLAMEYVRGKTLREWREVDERSAREIVGVYVQAGKGLEAAHVAGILHRDFKPDNVLVDEAGRARVLDFGLARFDSTSAPLPATASLALDDTGVHSTDALGAPLTAVGAILGTPAYMAPEQLQGGSITARSDQFSFCLALYEALYGERPFGGDTVAERAADMLAGRLNPIRREARVPSRVRRVLLRGLSGAEEARFESMSALLSELERAVSSPRWWGFSIAATAVALSVGAIVAARPAKVNPCLGADQAIASAWSPQRAEVVARSFAGSGNPRADEAFAHTKPLLDRYAASWVAMSTDACLATRVRGVQSDEGLDLRSACLHQRESELQASVDLLSHADAKLVDEAALVAARLAPVDTCVDVAALRTSFAPPKDDAQRRAIEVLRRRLAEVGALVGAGKYADAYPSAVDLVDAATRVDYGPTRAEALFWKGRSEFGLDRAEAPATFEDAALEAEGTRDDSLAADSWIRAFDVSADRQAPEDARRFGRLADAAVSRLRGASPNLQVHLLRSKSFDANVRHERAESLMLAREALALAEKTLEPGSHEVTLARSGVADALFEEGEVAEALPIYERVHREEVSLLGASHATSHRSLTDIGDCQIVLGDYAAAVETLEPMQTMSLASKPNGVIYGRVLLSEALVGSGRVSDGLALFDAAQAVVAEHPEWKGALGDTVEISWVLVEREENAQAETLANRALAGLAKEGDLEDDVKDAHAVRALCRVRRGDAAGGLADAEVALTKSEARSARRRLLPLLARGEALLLLQREAEGLAEIERALSIVDGTRGDLAIRADTRLAAARALSATHGDAARITALATRAADELDRAGLPDAAKQARSWLAR